MSYLKKSKTLDLKYISEKRKKEVEQVFNTLGLMDQKHLPNYSHLSEDYSMPFKQFSVLRTQGLVFKTTSNSG